MHLLTPVAALVSDPKIAAFIGTAIGASVVAIIRAFVKKPAPIPTVPKEKWFHYIRFRLEYDPSRLQITRKPIARLPGRRTGSSR